MNLLEIYNGWKKLEVWSQIGIAIGIGGIVVGFLGLVGVHMRLADLSILLSFCGFCLLVYGNIQQSRKLSKANDELSKVDGEIDQATASVYAHKKEEISKLEMEVATWKDKVASRQDKTISLENNAKEERIKAEQLLQSERDRFEKELSE
jgi:hypothetical protein